MLFGERLTSVRKRKKISQEELANKIGVHAPVIGRYERNEVKPSIEVAVNIANALGVSLDYLVGNTELELDTDTLKRIQDIIKLPEEEKTQVFKVVDALIRDFKAKQAYAS